LPNLILTGQLLSSRRLAGGFLLGGLLTGGLLCLSGEQFLSDALGDSRLLVALFLVQPGALECEILRACNLVAGVLLSGLGSGRRLRDRNRIRLLIGLGDRHNSSPARRGTARETGRRSCPGP
jgi:hypothetical protein